MGVKNLLGIFAPIMHERSLEDFKGQKIAVDGNMLVYIALSTSCVLESFYGLHDKILERISAIIQIVLRAGIILEVVFDGTATLPAKNGTDRARANRGRGMWRLLRVLYKTKRWKQARSLLRRCFKASQALKIQVCKYLHFWGVRWFFAPYEADAQLVYQQSHHGWAWIWSRDSDLLVRGASRLIVDFNAAKKTFTYIRRSHFHRLKADDWTGSAADFNGAPPERRRQIVIGEVLNDPGLLVIAAAIAGCDYVHLRGVGLVTAFFATFLWRTPGRIVQELARRGFCIPMGYWEKLEIALASYRHQTVYDEASEELCPCSSPTTPLGPGIQAYIGSLFAPVIVPFAVAGMWDFGQDRPFLDPTPHRRPITPLISWRDRYPCSALLPMSRHEQAPLFPTWGQLARRCPHPRLRRIFGHPSPSLTLYHKLKESFGLSRASVVSAALSTLVCPRCTIKLPVDWELVLEHLAGCGVTAEEVVTGWNAAIACHRDHQPAIHIPSECGVIPEGNICDQCFSKPGHPAQCEKCIRICKCFSVARAVRVGVSFGHDDEQLAVLEVARGMGLVEVDVWGRDAPHIIVSYELTPALLVWARRRHSVVVRETWLLDCVQRHTFQWPQRRHFWTDFGSEDDLYWRMKAARQLTEETPQAQVAAAKLEDLEMLHDVWLNELDRERPGIKMQLQKVSSCI